MVKWLTEKIVNNYVRKQVIQGVDHHTRIEGLFYTIVDACMDEFIEDSKRTIDLFLIERFTKSLKEANKRFKL